MKRDLAYGFCPGRMAPSPTGYFHVGTRPHRPVQLAVRPPADGVTSYCASRTPTPPATGPSTPRASCGPSLARPRLRTRARTSSRSGGRCTTRPSPADWPGASSTPATAPRSSQRARPAAGRPPGYDGYCRDRGLRAGDPGRLLRFRTPDSGTTSWRRRHPGRGHLRELLDRGLRRPQVQRAAAVHFGQRGRRRRHGHQPRHPGRGPCAQHAQVPPAVGGPRARAAAALRPPARCSSTSPGKSCPSAGTKWPSRTTADEGYLPEAMFNYLALLGWSPGDDREILSRQELIDEFRLEDVKSSPAFFDEKKLASSMPSIYAPFLPDEFVARASDGSTAAGRRCLRSSRNGPGPWLRSTPGRLPLPPRGQDRPGGLGQGPAPAAGVRGPAGGGRRRYAACDWEAAAIREATVEAGAAVGVNSLGKAQAPVRLAVTGRTVGPPLFDSLVLLGRRAPWPGSPPPGSGRSSRTRPSAADHARLRRVRPVPRGTAVPWAPAATSASMWLCPFGGGVIGNTTGSGPVIGGSSPPPRATPRDISAGQSHALQTEMHRGSGRDHGLITTG